MADFVRHSEKNGSIIVRQGADGTRVIVDGYNESSPGLNAIWREALLKAEPLISAPEPRVLILGLGGGGMLAEVHQVFPGSRILAVEHDPAMIDITYELQWYAPYPEPEIMCADAFDVVKDLEERFHLIAVDLFRGGAPSPHLLNAAFIQALKARLSKGGALLVNVADSPSFIDEVGKQFERADIWKSRENYVGMFTE